MDPEFQRLVDAVARSPRLAGGTPSMKESRTWRQVRDPMALGMCSFWAVCVRGCFPSTSF